MAISANARKFIIIGAAIVVALVAVALVRGQAQIPAPVGE